MGLKGCFSPSSEPALPQPRQRGRIGRSRAYQWRRQHWCVCAVLRGSPALPVAGIDRICGDGRNLVCGWSMAWEPLADPQIGRPMGPLGSAVRLHGPGNLPPDFVTH